MVETQNKLPIRVCNPDRTPIGGGGGGVAFDGVYQQPSGHVSGNTMQEWIDLHFSSIPPTMQIQATPGFGLREFGNDITNPQIGGRGGLGGNPTGTLTLMEFWRGGIGGVEINPDEVNPAPNTWYSRTDNFVVSSNQTYSVRITDSEGRTRNASGSFTFTYPYYWGVVDEDTDIFNGMTRGQILALPGMSLHVQTAGTKSFSSDPTNARFCFMYPASYGALSSIIDDNGFETISDYDTFSYNFVGLDGSSQTYRVYILKADTTQTNFTNTYHL